MADMVAYGDRSAGKECELSAEVAEQKKTRKQKESTKQYL